MTHILLMYSWHIIQPTFFLLLSWQNTSAAVWKCVPLLQLQNSSFKKSFYMFALNDEEKKNKTPCDGTDNRSLCTRGTNVCGWFCMWGCRAHLQDITQGETVVLRKPENTLSLLSPHCSDYKLGENFSEPRVRVSDFDSSSYCSVVSVSPTAPSG